MRTSFDVYLDLAQLSDQPGLLASRGPIAIKQLALDMLPRFGDTPNSSEAGFQVILGHQCLPALQAPSMREHGHSGGGHLK